ncbi:MAG TPA: hypothetical protein VHW68_07970 [Actinomycetota bacterium]|jgi:hypothetical protein|nr:hypothetical protein [Actinomycetota bacterium]
MARRPHAAARARIVATFLSIAAFGGIGRAIDVAANASVAAAASARTATSSTLPSGLPSGKTGSAAIATTNSITTTKAVTTTHAS